MIKDFWIYQQRQNPKGQWAVYVERETKRGHMSIDFTIYSEAIENSGHSVSVHDLEFTSPVLLANAVIIELLEFTEVTAQDKAQLEKSFINVLNA